MAKTEKYPKKYPQTKVVKTKTGKGVIALEEIKKGRKISQYIGYKVLNEVIDKNPNRYVFYLDEIYSLDGSPRWNPARYFNHSCVPNAESVQEGDDRIFIVAKKRIPVGTEITFDYGKDYIRDFFKKSGCKCPKCNPSFA